VQTNVCFSRLIVTDKPRSSGAESPKSKKLDPHQIIDANFLAGASSSGSLLAPTMAEIAFAGRSNVGKSSLINSLVERKGLVRTGATPGVTRQINFFEARARDGAVFHLVDLPGYGYSKVSKSERSAWQTLIENYLRTRVTLAALALLVDVRRGVEEDDAQLISFVDEMSTAQRLPVEVVIIATKIDKLGVAARRAALADIAKNSRRKALGFSSETGEGRAELWRILRKATFRGAPATDGP
jgi:GTP-binding protein